jgi:hypothetical protein
MYQGLKHINYQFITELISKMYSDWGIIPYLIILILVIYYGYDEFKEFKAEWKDNKRFSLIFKILIAFYLFYLLYFAIVLFFYYMVFS